MNKNTKNKNKNSYPIKIKSEIHPEIYHTILIDLHCYEKMPKGKKIVKQRQNTKNNNSKHLKLEQNTSI